ncbi:hypothetical protein QBC34DRAFT_396004 [Podospora aff. communis PSN243]|uniref:Uncharacterized protein n=1 Tax=Podospora aff. communis PSN243 TaxID=3040156 RepID=A0AAV9GX56_9PEZI|nr:hypothetical protein QBC34DRAFT_396004 [Podospora aff. communis PSN243]
MTKFEMALHAQSTSAGIRATSNARVVESSSGSGLESYCSVPVSQGRSLPPLRETGGMRCGRHVRDRLAVGEHSRARSGLEPKATRDQQLGRLGADQPTCLCACSKIREIPRLPGRFWIAEALFTGGLYGVCCLHASHRPSWMATCCHAATSAGRSMRDRALVWFLIWNGDAESHPNSPTCRGALTNADSIWPCLRFFYALVVPPRFLDQWRFRMPTQVDSAVINQTVTIEISTRRSL